MNRNRIEIEPLTLRNRKLRTENRELNQANHESNNPMDHLSHPLSSQSQATHHQPHLHRRSRPSTFRTQRRLPRRILRRCSSHCPSSDLRRYLRAFALERNSRAERDPRAQPNSSHAIAAAVSVPKISPTLSRSPQRRRSLPITDSPVRPVEAEGDFHSPLTTNYWLLLLYEPTINFPCGKQIPHPRIKPVIIGDTTYGVSLLTDTISGSTLQSQGFQMASRERSHFSQAIGKRERSRGRRE